MRAQSAPTAQAVSAATAASRPKNKRDDGESRLNRYACSHSSLCVSTAQALAARAAASHKTIPPHAVNKLFRCDPLYIRLASEAADVAEHAALAAPGELDWPNRFYRKPESTPATSGSLNDTDDVESHVALNKCAPPHQNIRG